MTFVCSLWTALTATAVERLSPKFEVRAVWLATIGGIDWPHTYSRSAASARKQQQELIQILDRLQAAGINTVLLQTRVRATTIYPSLHEPWDGCLSGIPGTSPQYDALQFAIDECHRRGMELHAWIVAVPIGKWNHPGATALRKKQPRLLKRIGDSGYMNPELPATADYIAKLCKEITENYDVDGIHLDYIRYPETWPKPKNKAQAVMRRAHITRIVRAVHLAVKSVKPWVKLSCSPIGKHDDLPRYSSNGWNAYGRVFQEAQRWMHEGLIDQLYPMMYFRDNQFFPFLFDWMENCQGRSVVSGIGAYMLSPQERDWPLCDVERQLYQTRERGAGYAFFRSKFFTDDTKGLYRFVCEQFNTAPALTPPMSWESDIIPDAPKSVRLTRTDSADCLTWDKTYAPYSGSYTSYNIYAAPVAPVDIQTAENLIAIKKRDNSICILRKPGQPMLHYAVTAIDRFGNESLAAQTSPGVPPAQPTHTAQATQLFRPDFKGERFLLIESLQGCLITTLPCHEGRADFASLPDGTYTVRSLNRKGISHRLAHLDKKGKKLIWKK